MRHRKRTGNRFVANPKSGKIFEGWLSKIIRMLMSTFSWEKEEIAELIRDNYDDVTYWWDARTERGSTFNANYVAEAIDRQFDYNARVLDVVEHLCGTEAADAVTAEELRRHWHKTRETGTPHSAGEAAKEIITDHGFPITTDAEAAKVAEYLDKHGRQTQPPRPREDNVADFTPDIGVQREGKDAALSVLGDILAPPESNSEKHRDFMKKVNEQAVARGEEPVFSDLEIQQGAVAATDETDQPLKDEPTASAEGVLREMGIDMNEIAQPVTDDAE